MANTQPKTNAIALTLEAAQWLLLRQTILTASRIGTDTGDFSGVPTRPYSIDADGAATEPVTEGAYPITKDTSIAALALLTSKPRGTYDQNIALTLQLDAMESFRKQLIARRQRKQFKLLHLASYNTDLPARLASIKKELCGPVANPRPPKPTT